MTLFHTCNKCSIPFILKNSSYPAARSSSSIIEGRGNRHSSIFNCDCNNGVYIKNWQSTKEYESWYSTMYRVYNYTDIKSICNYL